MKKHRGMSMVELLGAIVIFSIATSIIAMTISFIVKGNRDIIEQGQANTTGVLIIKQIENKIQSLNITDYDLIANNDLSLYSDYEYVFDEVANDVVLITHTPPLSMTLIYLNGDILLNGNMLDLSQFSLDSSSKIEIITDPKTASLIITVVLSSEQGKLYVFKTNLQLGI